ncbi:hypothetical protein [Haloferula sp. BvORR071]|uniref:hypothetical protein n=1 Tax=Haloferula sp. BvORR071 TaxID=1396141 RepID=UPI0005500CB2|nr:hypothetical protein [Haloferula sp. BvORR071]
MRIAPLLATAFLAAAGLAGAQVINIDFDKAGSIVSYQGLAAASDPSGATAIWNSVTAAGSSIAAVNLLDSDGQTTGVGLSLGIDGSFLSTPGEQELGAASQFAGLMGDYVYLSSPTTTDIVTKAGTITGLDAGKLYDVYLYGQGDKFSEILYSEGQNTLFTLNGIAKQTSWDGIAGGNGVLTEGVEYVKYSVNADVNGEIAFIWQNVVSGPGGNVTVDTDGANSRFAAINGIQIVDVAAVPEPGAALLGAAGLLLLVRRRR